MHARHPLIVDVDSAPRLIGGCPGRVRCVPASSAGDRAQLLATIDDGGECGRPPTPPRLGARHRQSVVSARAATTREGRATEAYTGRTWPAMYLVCKYAPFKRVLQPQPPSSSASSQHHHQQHQQPKDARRHDAAAVKELQHLNHKIVSCRFFSTHRFLLPYTV